MEFNSSIVYHLWNGSGKRAKKRNFFLKNRHKINMTRTFQHLKYVTKRRCMNGFVNMKIMPSSRRYSPSITFYDIKTFNIALNGKSRSPMGGKAGGGGYGMKEWNTEGVEHKMTTQNLKAAVLFQEVWSGRWFGTEGEAECSVLQD